MKIIYLFIFQRAGQSNNLFPQLNASLNLSQSQDSLFDIKSQSYPVANLNRYDRLPNIGKNGLGINLTPPKRKQSIWITIGNWYPIKIICRLHASTKRNKNLMSSICFTRSLSEWNPKMCHILLIAVSEVYFQ